MRELIGRDAQLGDARAWLGDRSALPSSLLLEGAPGIGKSSFVRGVLAIAAGQAYHVLCSTPAEAEAELAYAGLGDLTAGPFETVLPTLPGPQREALEIALLLRPSEVGPPDVRAVAVAFLGGVRRLTATGPVLLVVDDWQWLDPATSAVVRFTVRRLTREPVGILLARRRATDGGAAGWPADLPAPRAIELGALSLGAIHAVVHDRLDLVLSRPLLRRLHERSGGNPLWALELARGIKDGRLTLDPDEALPPDLVALVGERIRSLPHETRLVLAALAAMPRPSLERTRALLDGGDPSDALHPAVAQEVVTLDGDRVGFSHPLHASVALGLLDAAGRRTLHRRLAPGSPDPDERVRHLALAAEGPDAAVAAELELVAADLGRRAGAVEAAELLALARRSTPPDDLVAIRRRVLLEADARLEAGDPSGAAGLLEAALRAAAPGPQRAQVLARLARILHFRADVAGGVALLRDALAEPGLDPALQGGIEEGLAWGLLLMRVDLAAAWRHARASAAAAETTRDPTAMAEALAAVALTELVHGQPPSEALGRALALESAGAVAHLRVLRHPTFAAAYVEACIDELPSARARYDQLLERAEDRGDESAAATLRAHLALVHALLGDLDRGAAFASDGAELAFQAGLGPTRASALGRLALVQAWRGDRTAATEAAARSLALADPAGSAPHDPADALARGGEHALWASGEVALAADDAPRAVRFLEPLAGALRSAGVREPGELRFLPALVDGLVRTGDLDRAAEHAAFLHAEAERVGRPGAMAAALLARGTVEAAGGRLEAASGCLEEASRLARAAPLPMELGRTLLALGRVQRRLGRKRDARGSLMAAAELLASIGARGWASAAELELGRIGGRAPAGDRLTPTEVRVAGLVAQGWSNKEIAAELVVTPKAVEAVLGRLFAKLDVRSRSALTARMLSEEQPGKA